MSRIYRSPNAETDGRLSPEDVDLWQRVTRNVRPTRLPSKQHAQKELDKVQRATRAPSLVRAKNEIRSDATITSAKAPIKTANPLAKMDHRERRKISRGRIVVDSAIDLHGMRQHEAHRELSLFLARAQAGNARVVLVITGKGCKGMFLKSGIAAESMGVLRRMVPLWLRTQELRQLVLGFEEAISAHGGAGALYVKLRRSPKNR